MPAPVTDRDDDTRAEKVVDGAIHIVGLTGAAIALGYLIAGIGPGATTRQYLALAVYGTGLLGMLSMSALYNLSPPGAWKTIFRTCDRAMIFVMIAGSYTPFAVSAFPPDIGLLLCTTIWALAALGVTISIAWTRLYDRISIALYLGMGWVVLAVLPPLVAAVSATVLTLLVSGGVVYSLGVIIHTRGRAAFHNAAWHVMVVTAAALHLAAVALVLT
ncbi:MAG: hemolysin III family protein [Acetobacteraceae bacterium]|nr:hemolysin III family protein [Pseudomonadota bacterium]